MTDFYQKTPEEQGLLLKNLALKSLEAWSIGREIELDLIKHRENAVFKVTAGQKKYVLRVHRAGYHSDDALRSELQWMEALLQSGIDTPEIIKTRQGDAFAVAEIKDVPEQRQVDLFAWIDGVPISDLTEKKDEMSMHFRIGELMARLHNHAQNWTPPEDFTRHAWDEAGLLGENPVWGRFWELAYFTEEDREKILRAREITKRQLQEFGKTHDRYGLIHCDFLPENLLKDGKTLRIIDFDDCGYGWHMFDIATSMFAYALEANFEEIKTAFFQGYRSQRELSDEQLKYYNLFMLLRVMTSCGWIHTRPETQTAKDFGAFLANHLVVEVEDFLSVC